MKSLSSGCPLFLLIAAQCICTGQEIRALSAPGLPVDFVHVTQAQKEAIQLRGLEYVVPELILGGEWTSTIRLTNRGTKAIPATNVYFLDNAGNPMKATFQVTNGSVISDIGFTFSLSVGSILEGTFVGGSSTVFGHGLVGCSADGCGTPGLYGEVTLRNRNSTRPDFESVFPFEAPAPLQYMLFDGRNGFTTVLYLANENTTSTGVALDIVDTSHRLIRTVNLTLRSLESQILTLHVLAPETTGIQGTLVLTGSNNNSVALITATGLRINPSNSFTPLRAFIPAP